MSLLEDLHRAHRDRQRKFFPPPPPPHAIKIPTPIGLRLAPNVPTSLPLVLLIREAERIEDMFFNDVAIALLGEHGKPRPPGWKGRMVSQIQRIVAEFYNSSVVTICSSSRLKRHVFPRQVAAYLSRKFTGLSMPELGHRFGGRDHTTIMHAIHKIARLASEDERLRDELQLLIMRICETTGIYIEPEKIHAEN